MGLEADCPRAEGAAGIGLRHSRSPPAGSGWHWSPVWPQSFNVLRPLPHYAPPAADAAWVLRLLVAISLERWRKASA